MDSVTKYYLKKEVPIMVRGLLLSISMLLLITACTTGPLRDIRIGKTFAVLAPDEIAIHKKPVRGSETFHLEEPEAFIVDTALCEGGGSLASCWADLMATVEDPESFGAVFYKVVFESGTEGYINGRYFYPKLSYYMTSEERSTALGTTPVERASVVRKRYKDAEAALIEEENNRKSYIESAPWPEDIKKLVLGNKLKIGMTIEQARLSKNPSERPAFKPYILRKASETVTEEGVIEKWVLRDLYDKTMKTLYFLDGRLTRWETMAR